MQVKAVAQEPSAPPAAYQAAFEALQAAPLDPQAAFDFAVVAAEAGDLSGAAQALERVLLMAPDLSNIKAELGLIYARLGSFEAAERYLTEAKQAPDMPAEVAATVAEAMALIDKAQSRNAYQLELAGGFRSESNAFKGPAADPALISGTEAPGTAAYLSGRLSYRRDLGYQDRRSFDAQLGLSAVSYFDDGPEDYLTGDGLVGFSFAIDPQSEAQVGASVSQIFLEGETYRTRYGVLVGFGRQLSPELAARGQLFAGHQKYSNTASQGAASERTGAALSASASTSFELAGDANVVFGANLAREGAEVDHQKFWDVGLTAVYSNQIAFLPAQPKTTLGLSFGLGARSYDAANPGGTITRRRHDERLRAGLFASHPVSDLLAVTSDLSWVDSSSNEPVESYENVTFSLGLRLRLSP